MLQVLKHDLGSSLELLTSDPLQADLRSSLGDGGYVVFGVILFVWELLPTSLVVFFFRVRRPPQERVSLPARLGHMTLATTWTREPVGFQILSQHPMIS